MKKYHLIGVFVCFSWLLIIGANAQDKNGKREEIAKITTKELEKGEAEKESALKLIIIQNKEYSEVLPDDSYLVELANNVEAGHLHTMTSCTSFRKPTKDLMCSVTQETAFGSGKHLVSHTTPISFLDSNHISGVGDIALTYRYQLTGEKDWAVVSPRISLLIPSGKKDKGLGVGSTGVQFNLPVTKRLSESFLGTFNAGVTFFPKYKGEDSAGNSVKKSVANYNLGGSLIWVAHKNINPLVEYVENFAGEIGEDSHVQRFNEHILSPGVGLAWEFKGIKVSPGFAVPINFSHGEKRTGIFFYLAFDHLFFKQSSDQRK